MLLAPGSSQELFQIEQRSQYLAPGVWSPMTVCERMLELANLKAGETVFDLGSGDGRVLIIAAQRFGAKAVGVEISENLVKRSKERIEAEGLSQRVNVIHDDLMNVDISAADVVTIYLLRDSNDVLRPKLEASLRPGARVVSHDYEIRGWKPVVVEKAKANNRPHAIYLYEIPKKKTSGR
jgi:protein-L-isoaspartate O-methyltransferase